VVVWNPVAFGAKNRVAIFFLDAETPYIFCLGRVRGLSSLYERILEHLLLI
jgi:hypothetical protein